MSHTLASRCTVCGVIDDNTCPECGVSSAVVHGTTDQRPWHSVLSDGYVHEWHPECVTTPTPAAPSRRAEVNGEGE